MSRYDGTARSKAQQHRQPREPQQRKRGQQPEAQQHERERGQWEPQPWEPEPISPELEQLTDDMIELGLSALGQNGELMPVLSLEDSAGKRETLVFENDGLEECLTEARATVRRRAGTRRYTLAYDGAIREDGASHYESALILEYGEQGMGSGYSAYLLYRGAGQPTEFVWTDPQAAGETELLL